MSQIFVVVTSLIMLVLCIVGVVRVKEGLDLTDVVPKNTNEYSFLEAQSKYFGFYNFYAVTKVCITGDWVLMHSEHYWHTNVLMIGPAAISFS